MVEDYSCVKNTLGEPPRAFFRRNIVEVSLHMHCKLYNSYGKRSWMQIDSCVRWWGLLEVQGGTGTHVQLRKSQYVWMTPVPHHDQTCAHVIFCKLDGFLSSVYASTRFMYWCTRLQNSTWAARLHLSSTSISVGTIKLEIISKLPELFCQYRVNSSFSITTRLIGYRNLFKARRSSALSFHTVRNCVSYHWRIY